MSAEEAQSLAICNFITKICSMERQIELKRQKLCDRNDFEPYVAFQRLLRNGSEGITSSNLMKFLSENLIDVRINDARSIVSHYDGDKDGILSYKEFLDIVLPKEHPDLRAFVTQRECFDIKDEEYLSYETEAAMAVALSLELAIYEFAISEKQELDRLELDGPKIVDVVDSKNKKNLNFNNLQKFLHNNGLMPYDAEIINFLRRIDVDDDGVISGEELNFFLEKFSLNEDILPMNFRRNHPEAIIREDKLKSFSPNRKIVSNQYIMLSPEYGRVNFESKEEAMVGDTSKYNTKTKITSYGAKREEKEVVAKGGKVIDPLKEIRIEKNNLKEESRYTLKSIGEPKKEFKDSTVSKDLGREGSVLNIQDDKENNGDVKNVQVEVPNSDYKGKKSPKKRRMGRGSSAMKSGKKNPSEKRLRENRTGSRFGESQRKYNGNNPQNLNEKGRENETDKKGDTLTSSRLENITLRSHSKYKENKIEPRESTRPTYTSKYANSSSRNVPERRFSTQNLEKNNIPKDPNPENPKKEEEKPKVQKEPEPQNPVYQPSQRESYSSKYKHPPREYKKMDYSKYQRSNRTSFQPQNTHSNTATSYQKHQPKYQPMYLSSTLNKQPEPPKINPSQPLLEISNPQNTSKYQPKYESKYSRTQMSNDDRSSYQILRGTPKTYNNYNDKSPIDYKKSKEYNSKSPVSNIEMKNRRLSSNLPISNTENNLQSASKISRAETEARGPAEKHKHEVILPSPSKSIFTTGRSSIDRQSLSQINHQKGQKHDPKSPKENIKIEQHSNHDISNLSGSIYSTFKDKSALQNEKLISFTSLFKKILLQERKVEEIKRRIFSQPDFNPAGLFNLLENGRKPYFTFEEFRNFLTNISLKKTTAKSMIDFYSSFDANDKRMLDIDQLVNMIMPNDGNAKNRIFETPQNPEEFKFSEATKKLLKETFEVLFESRQEIHNCKKIMKSKGIEIHEVFDVLDISQNEKLSKSEFINFLTEFSPEFKESENHEIELFLKNCDIDKDGFINFKDFYMFFSV